jgi:hypothetical protein
MPLPGLFPIYPESGMTRFHVSLSIPSLTKSEILKPLGITASYPLLFPNVDYLQEFIKGNLGISEKITQETIFKNLNNSYSSNNEEVFSTFAKNSDVKIDDINKYKKDGKFKIPKNEIQVPKSEGMGFKGFEKTLLTSIFETQKPYLEIANLIIGNISKIEDVIARVMPLLSPFPLDAKSEKPSSNGGQGNRPKAIGYKSGKDIKESLSKLQSIYKKGGDITIDNDGKVSFITDNNPSNQEIINNSTQRWEIISSIYSTGTFDPSIDYKYTYINLPPEQGLPDSKSDLDLNDDGDLYKKYKPKSIILGIFNSEGVPLNPTEKIKTIGISNGNISAVDTPYTKAGWILQSPKWKFPSGQFVWPKVGLTPIYRWKRWSQTKDSKTQPASEDPAPSWEIKKYKSGDKNLLNGQDAIPDNPIIVGFESSDITKYSVFFNDLVKTKMNTADALTQPEKNQYSDEILGNLNIQSHLENVFLYGQGISFYNQTIPNEIKISMSPYQIFSAEAATDPKLRDYAIKNGKTPGMIWVDPEMDYETKIIRIDPTTQIEYEESQGSPEIKSTIKSFVKNKTIFKISDNSLFDISIIKDENTETFTDIDSYTLENWNYFNDPLISESPTIQNANVYDIKISSKNPTKYYSNITGEIYKSEDLWIEIGKRGDNWEYKNYTIDISPPISNNTPTDDFNPYQYVLLNLNYQQKENLYQEYLKNKSAIYGFNYNGINRTVVLSILFNRILYQSVEDGIKTLNDGSKVEVKNGEIIKWIYLINSFDINSLPPFGKERTFTIIQDGEITEGNLPIQQTNINIPLYKINVTGEDFPYGKIIDPSKITNDQLKSPNLFSKGRYGIGSRTNPQNIEIIKRFMLSDLDTESYYIIEGILVDENKQTGTNGSGTGSGSQESGYYRIPHAIGAIRVFISVLVDIFSKMIPNIIKLLKLFKNPASFVTDIIGDKAKNGFLIFSKESFNTFITAKSISGKNNSDKINKLENLFKESPLGNYVYVDGESNYKFLLDGVSMLPFEIFGIKIPFGMELCFSNLPSNPIRLIFNSDLPKSKVQNIQDFLNPGLEIYNGAGDNGVGSPLNTSSLQNQTQPTTNNRYEIINIEYSTGEYINGIDYNYIYITEDIQSTLNQIDELVYKDSQQLGTASFLAMELLNTALQENPNNQVLKDKKSELEKLFNGITDTCQPLLKVLLGLVTLPISLIGGIIEWILEFFKSLSNPLTLPAKMLEFLSFTWILNFFTPKGLLEMIGIKFDIGKISEWMTIANNPSTPDDLEIADFNQFFSAPFLPKLPTYTAKQFREHPERALKIFWPFICMIENFINGIIDFIWSTLGIEAVIPSPHIKICDKSKDPDIVDSNDLMDILNGNSLGSEPTTTNNQSLDGEGQQFIYEITLDDGQVIKGLNYEELQKFIDENQDINYNFNF